MGKDGLNITSKGCEGYGVERICVYIKKTPTSQILAKDAGYFPDSMKIDSCLMDGDVNNPNIMKAYWDDIFFQKCVNHFSINLKDQVVKGAKGFGDKSQRAFKKSLKLANGWVQFTTKFQRFWTI